MNKERDFRMKNRFDITGRKAIVTGACGGLGREIARALRDADAEVLAMDISDNLEEICLEDHLAYAVKANLGDRNSLKQGFDEALRALNGRIDILVNCAGVQRRYPCEDFPMEDWDFVTEINLNAVFELSQMAGRIMLAQGSGKIINVASMLSYFGGKNVPAYAASKGGVMQLTRALAVAWAKRNVQVNAIAPGYMATEMNTALMNDKSRSVSILERIPAGRWGNGEDVAGPVLFLASPASDYLSGAIIPVDGGYLSC